MGFTITTATEVKDLGVELSTLYYTFRGACQIRKKLVVNTLKYSIAGEIQCYPSKTLYSEGKNSLPGMNRYIEVVVDTLSNKEPMTELYSGAKTQLNLTMEQVVDDL